MKRTFAAICGASLLASFSVLAQDEKADRRFYITPMGEYFIGDKERQLEDASGYGINLGKIVGRGPNLELSYSVIEPDAESGERGPSLESIGIGIQMFPARLNVPWYILARVAQAKTVFSSDTGDQEAVSDQFDLGVGYMLGLGDWPVFGRGPALRLEARYRLDKYSADEATLYTTLAGVENQRTFHDYVIGVGLQIPLGPDPNYQPAVDAPTETVVVKALDSDGDLVPDEQDKCPNTPPGARVDVQGCERDDDGDGVKNSRDRCPATPAGTAVDINGCSGDVDGDGVSDDRDQCPRTPAGEPVLADGCALTGDCRIPRAGQTVNAAGCVAEDRVILKGVNFVAGSADLTGEAMSILRSVATALQGNHGVILEVGGHTDSQGSQEANLALSERRAIAVKKYLVSLGVASSHLTARGYGETSPIQKNATPDGRAANRRVELKVVGVN